MLKRILPILCILLVPIGLVQGKDIKASAGSESAATGTPVKLALLIGIGNYEDPAFSSLIGPSRDVESMRELLQSFYAFEPQNILLLRDRAATREAILAGFRKHLIENARKNPNAVIYIHLSGIGRTVPDLNGDEADGRDEAIVPYDGRPDGRNLVTDDDLDQILTELSGHTANVTFVYDTCYGFDESQPDRDRSGAVTSSGSQSHSSKNGLVIISASLPGQPAMDPSPLTAHLVSELARTPITTYRDLMHRVIARLSAENARQTPRVEGDIDRLFLGGVGRIFEVSTSTGSIAQLKLNGGRRQGLSEGVRVAVYKPKARSPYSYRDKLSDAVVIRATDVSATVELTRKVTVPSGAIATVIAPENREQIRVAFDQISLSGLANGPKVINSLTERFTNSASAVPVGEVQPNTKRSTTGDSWDVLVKSGKFGKVFGEARKQLETSAREESRELPGDDEEVLYLSGPNESPLFGFFVEATSAEFDEIVVEAIRQAAAQRRVQRLYNENSPLNKALEVAVVRVDGEVKVTGLLRIVGEHLVIAEEGSGTAFRLRYGELFRLKVRNKSSEQIYLTGFNLRADGRMKTFPEEGAGEKLAAGATYASPIFRATGLAGEDVFKFVVTTWPVNLAATTRSVSVIERPWGTTQVSLLVATPSPTETYARGRVVEHISKSLHVLALGINKPSDRRYQLRFSVGDARAVAAVLQERGSEMYNVRVHLLLDEQATRANIETAFNTVMREAQPEDAFIFYNAASDFVGPYKEGSENWFILPADVRGRESDSDWVKSAISGESLRNWVTGVKAQNQLLIFDSNSEGLDHFVLPFADDRKSAGILFRKNLVILRGNGIEVTDLGHAEFAYHLLRGLKGVAYSGIARNQITARDLLHFLSGAKSRSRGRKLFQTFSIGDDFSLGGVPAKLAEKTRDADRDTDFPDPELDRVKRTGKDYALLIATSDYGDDSGFDDLANPIRDAEAIGRVLEQQYGFEVEIAPNKTKQQIEQLIESKYLDIGSNDDDQLFIFFAGHGTYKEKLGDGGVAVKDSVAKDVNTYLRFAWLRDRLAYFKSKHVLVVVDVCYSGAFFRSLITTDRDPRSRTKMTDADYYKERIKNKTRKAIASSALKPVSDGVPGTHSPFATELLGLLRKPHDRELITFDDIKAAINRVKPGPVAGDFGGDPGSDFFFVPKQSGNPIRPER